jgi:hypothetical protein
MGVELREDVRGGRKKERVSMLLRVMGWKTPTGLKRT